MRSKIDKLFDVLERDKRFRFTERELYFIQLYIDRKRIDFEPYGSLGIFSTALKLARWRKKNPIKRLLHKGRYYYYRPGQNEYWTKAKRLAFFEKHS